MGSQCACRVAGFYPSVVVDSVSPDYYAQGEQTGTFTLLGHNFQFLPSDAIGIIAYNNNNPIEYRNSFSRSLLFNLEILSDGELKATPQEESSYLKPRYLGCIMSSDRSVMYWVNNTQPLP